MSEAQAMTRDLKAWCHKVEDGKIRLPQFQRGEAWDTGRICSLMNTIVRDLPLGITLILNVGDEELFASRPLSTAPESKERVTEQLLDGQQRLTAIWRVLHDNYEKESYFVEVEGLSEGEPTGEGEFVREARWLDKTGARKPLWCDKPSKCLARNLIPARLFDPLTDADQLGLGDWIEEALGGFDEDDPVSMKKFYQRQGRIRAWVTKVREAVSHYDLPYLALPAATPPDVVLDVFINMNTNGKPLSQFDIIAAQLEPNMAKMPGMSGRLIDAIEQLEQDNPTLAHFGDLSSILFNTESLVQGYPPNQTGAWKSDKDMFLQSWSANVKAIEATIDLLCEEGIVSEQILPSVSVLWVMSAINRSAEEWNVDQRGRVNDLLRQYLWRAFFTDRYEKSASSRAQQDYRGMKDYLDALFAGDEADINIIPIFDEGEYPLPELGALENAPWPKRKSTRARSILALSAHEGMLDFASGEGLTKCPLEKRHYHHVFPRALLEEAGVEDDSLALNCALIEDETNWDIGRKDPLAYLMDRFKWADEDVVRERLGSHLIPLEELRNGGYANIQGGEKAAKIDDDYRRFIQRRAELVRARAAELCGMKVTTDLTE